MKQPESHYTVKVGLTLQNKTGKEEDAVKSLTLYIESKIPGCLYALPGLQNVGAVESEAGGDLGITLHSDQEFAMCSMLGVCIVVNSCKM